MNKNRTKFWNSFITQFTLIATISTFIALRSETWQLPGFIGGSVITVLVFTWGIYKYKPFKTYKYDSGLKYLNKLFENVLPPSEEWSHHYVQNAAELKEIWSISQSLYGISNVDYDIVYSWWSCYPHGIYAIYKQSTIAGYFSMWPIKKATFNDILGGIKKEKQLKRQSILGNKAQVKRKYWYITNVVICKQFRNTKALKILMRETLRNWLKDGNLEEEIELCAFGFSENGNALIKNSGFKLMRSAEDTADKLPLYTLTSTKDEVNMITTRLLDENEKNVENI